MAGNASDQEPAKKQFLEEVFEDLEKKYKTPNPESISLGTVKFERFLLGVILPFVGLMSFFIAMLTLWSLEPGLSKILAGISFASAVVIFLWLLYRRRYTEQGARIFIGAGLVALSVALLSLQPGMLSFVLTVCAVYAVVGFVIFYDCSDRSFLLFFLLFPFVMSILRQHDLLARLVVEGAVLLPLFIVFYKKELRKGQFGVLFCGLLVAIIEIAAQKEGILALQLLLLAFIAVGIVYEMRIPSLSQSNLRQFMGLAPLALMILVFFAYTNLDDKLGWRWAIAVAIYQSILILREKLKQPSRIAWIAFSFCVAILLFTPQLTWFTKTAILLILSSLLHLISTKIGNKFLSDSAVFVLTLSVLSYLSGTKVYTFFSGTKEVYSVVNIIMGLLIAVGMLLISRRLEFKSSLAWWQGFLVSAHIERLKNFLLMIIGPFLRIPVFSFFFAIARSAFVWLKYFKGDNQAFRVNDLLFLSAQLFGILTIIQQLSLYLNTTDTTAARQGLILASIWIFWGFWLVVAGSRSKTVFHRLIGVSFILVPVITEIRYWNVKNTILHAGLVIFTSSALWLAVLIVRSHQLLDATDPSKDTDQVDREQVGDLQE